MSKKTIRYQFRKTTMQRDNYRCRCCGKKGKDRQEEGNIPNLDAHHITCRDDMPNGGYVKENGVSLCDECHIKAEDWLKNGAGEPKYSPENLYKLIGSSKELAIRQSESLK